MRCLGTTHNMIAQPGFHCIRMPAVADRIATTRRCIYRGRGVGLQVPWAIPTYQLLLVVSLFSGIGTSSMALFLLGAQFIAVLSTRLPRPRHPGGLSEHPSSAAEEQVLFTRLPRPWHPGGLSEHASSAAEEQASTCRTLQRG